jgi:hypothetical protein
MTEQIRRRPLILTPEMMVHIEQHSFPEMGEMSPEKATQFADNLRRFPMVYLGARYYVSQDGFVGGGDLPVELVAETFHKTVESLTMRGVVQPHTDQTISRLQSKYVEASGMGFGDRALIEQNGYEFQQLSASWDEDLPPRATRGDWIDIIERYRLAELIEQRWGGHEQA